MPRRAAAGWLVEARSGLTPGLRAWAGGALLLPGRPLRGPGRTLAASLRMAARLRLRLVARGWGRRFRGGLPGGCRLAGGGP